MTFVNLGILWQGWIQTDKGAWRYTPPPGLRAFITSIRAVNTSGATVTINVYITKAGSADSMNYADKGTSLAAGVGVQVVDDPQELRLGVGDYIEADASTADVVALTIMGGEGTL